jgi:hypothetical protein
MQFGIGKSFGNNGDDCQKQKRKFGKIRLSAALSGGRRLLVAKFNFFD